MLSILTLVMAPILHTPLSVKAAEKNSYANPEYYKAIYNVINQYGICKADISAYSAEGLAYVELIDFDNNGTKELYMIYLEHSGDYEKNVVQEIWGIKNKKTVKSFRKVILGVG